MEAVRTGTILSHDQKQYSRWRQRIGRGVDGVRRSGGLTGLALERAVGLLAARNPEYVVYGESE